jgi:hypothetical protein
MSRDTNDGATETQVLSEGTAACATEDQSGAIDEVDGMNIVRISKRDNPFVIIDKRALEDSRMSWKAKGLLAYLLTLPDDWTIRLAHLQKQSSDGMFALRSAMQELIDLGYAEIHEERENGKFAGSSYTVYESPRCGFPNAGKPHTEKPHTEKPHAGNHTLLNNHIPSNHIPNTQDTKEEPHSEGSAGKRSKRAKKEGSPKFEKDSWQTKCAEWIMGKLEAFGALHPSVLINRDRAQVVDEWADEIDKLVRLDNFEKSYVVAVFKWLLAEDPNTHEPVNWWITSGNFGSVQGIRQRKSGKRKWDTIALKFNTERLFTKKDAPRVSKDVDMRTRRQAGVFK